ncbi:dephospho-CoA kinase [Alteromonas sp. 5E99-2]|uniref:dephospho-CoA kinase n=1 Tax=Alteromonas sp. 5E99-2 TaxID=2817683 RepID=UPI001A9982A6|nr:dephospho-CoA kinase [Alteromonas sp. 5E99-2]
MSSCFSIGLTGGIGSGKSTVSKLFVNNGITLVDADQIARDVVAAGQPVLNDIVHTFGKEALLSDGNLNRNHLRQCVFSDPSKKQWLNQTLHPLIRSEMLSQMNKAKSSYCIVDVPLLTENKMSELFHRVLVVDCAVATQMHRAMARDNATEEGIQHIIEAQATREQRRAIANDVITNESTLQALEKQVIELHHLYIKMAASVSG